MTKVIKLSADLISQTLTIVEVLTSYYIIKLNEFIFPGRT